MRKFAERKDIVIISILLLVSAAGYLALNWTSRAGSLYAEIYCNGALIDTVDLYESDDYYLTYDEIPQITFHVYHNGVAFHASDCPDKICIKSGYLRISGQTAVCMPNRTYVVVHRKGGDDEIDSISR